MGATGEGRDDRGKTEATARLAQQKQSFTERAEGRSDKNRSESGGRFRMGRWYNGSRVWVERQFTACQSVKIERGGSNTEFIVSIAKPV